MKNNRTLKHYQEDTVLFRAKPENEELDGKWVYGWYEYHPFNRFPCKPSIIPKNLAESGEYRHVRVDGNTVCQFSGLRDKNLTPIYTGDIVTNHLGDKQVVVFENGSFRFIDRIEFIFGERGGDNFCACSKRFVNSEKGITADTVIGNIFDDPEWLDPEYNGENGDGKRHMLRNL